MDMLKIYTTEITHQEFKGGLLDWQKVNTWNNTNSPPTADNFYILRWSNTTGQETHSQLTVPIENTKS